jgi:hypothetical protein
MIVSLTGLLMFFTAWFAIAIPTSLIAGQILAVSARRYEIAAQMAHASHQL